MVKGRGKRKKEGKRVRRCGGRRRGEEMEELG